MDLTVYSLGFYFWKGGEDNVIELSTHRGGAVFAPALMAVHAEWRDGGFNPREALARRRSG
jgi:hypothetical protein